MKLMNSNLSKTRRKMTLLNCNMSKILRKVSLLNSNESKRRPEAGVSTKTPRYAKRLLRSACVALTWSALYWPLHLEAAIGIEWHGLCFHCHFTYARCCKVFTQFEDIVQVGRSHWAHSDYWLLVIDYWLLIIDYCRRHLSIILWGPPLAWRFGSGPSRVGP